ncbi:UvrD-helicase domain-containing protein [Mycolicibacterium mucogenicum]|uniref:UvrD-helicase domain-containing protein n=1 Tax=Mycolicibacterium mucogenicum TaxID=56689 RepID=UPI0039777F5F
MTTYTDAQRAAIDCLGQPLQIIACAGSGKTQVISQRIAKILGLPGVEPEQLSIPVDRVFQATSVSVC